MTERPMKTAAKPPVDPTLDIERHFSAEELSRLPTALIEAVRDLVGIAATMGDLAYCRLEFDPLSGALTFYAQSRHRAED